MSTKNKRQSPRTNFDVTEKLAASVRKQCESPDFQGIKQKGMVVCIFVEYVYQPNKNLQSKNKGASVICQK